MAKQNILVGAVANDKSGDTLRNAFVKVNANFSELYTLTGGTSTALTELAQDYAAPMFTHAYNSGITFAYDDANNRLVATVSGQLPTQTGNSAKYLTTNGTTLSWAGVGRLEFAGKTISLGNNGYITLASGAQLYDYGSGTGNGFGITDSQASNYIGYDPDDGAGALHMDSYNGKNIRIRTTTLPSTYKDWLFGANGSLTFPDASVQTKAYTGLTPNGTKASNDTGTAGQTSYDTQYFYVCVATNSWRRMVLDSY